MSNPTPILANIVRFGWRVESRPKGGIQDTHSWRVVRVATENEDLVVIDGVTKRCAEAVAAECLAAWKEAWCAATCVTQAALDLIPDEAPLFEAEP